MLSGFPKYTLGQSTLFFLVNKADSVLLGLNIIAQYESNLLESVHVEAGRIIIGLRINSSKTKLYVEFGCEPLYKRREKHKLILMYKIINGFKLEFNFCFMFLQKDKFSLRQVVHSTD
jgi:hypothetical protein